MKFSSLLLGFLIIELPTIELVFQHKFTNISCETSELKTCVNKFCYITTTEKSLTVASFGCTLTKALKGSNFTIQQFYKTGNSYREVLKIPTLDWNDVLSGKKLNPFLNIVINMLKKSDTSIFQKFPWTGSVEVLNLSIENHSFFSIFPKGEYKTVFWFGPDEDKIVFKNILISTLKTTVEARN